MHPDQTPQTKKDPSPWLIYGMVGELGSIIALPAVAFGIGGAYLDRLWGTSPLLVLTGFFIAAAVSWRGVKHFIQRVQDLDRSIPVTKKAIEDGKKWVEEIEKNEAEESH